MRRAPHMRRAENAALNDGSSALLRGLRPEKTGTGRRGSTCKLARYRWTLGKIPRIPREEVHYSGACAGNHKQCSIYEAGQWPAQQARAARGEEAASGPTRRRGK